MIRAITCIINELKDINPYDKSEILIKSIFLVFLYLFFGLSFGLWLGHRQILF